MKALLVLPSWLTQLYKAGLGSKYHRVVMAKFVAAGATCCIPQPRNSHILCIAMMALVQHHRGAICHGQQSFGRSYTGRPCVQCRSNSAGRYDLPPTHPRQTLHRCLEICQRKYNTSLQPLLDYLPSKEIARGLVVQNNRSQPHQSSSSSPVMFEQVIEGMLLTHPSDHFLDSWALRNLVLNPPASYQELSGLMVGPDTYKARCAVSAPSGEEAVLTFTLKKNVVPGSQTSQNPSIASKPPNGSIPSIPHASQTKDTEDSDPSLLYVDEAPMGIRNDTTDRSAGRFQQTARLGGFWPDWRLAAIQGEPRFHVLPTTPSPEFPPESIVQAQLNALQTYDFAQSFQLLSPAAQTLVGPIDRFIASMGRSRLYRPLVNHRSATTLRRCQSSANTYLEVVAVEPERPAQGTALYCWIVTKQQEPGGALHDCWMTEWVKVVDDPKLRHVLGLPSANSRNNNRSDDESDGRTGRH